MSGLHTSRAIAKRMLDSAAMRSWLVICAVLITTPAFADPSASTAQPRSTETTSRLPDILIGAGSAMLVFSVVYHATEFRYVANKLHDATDSTPDPAEYDRYSDTFDTHRELLIGMYAASAITLGTAIYLEHRNATRVQPSVALVPGGGMLTLGWSR